MPKHVQDRGTLRPVEIGRLKRVFDRACLLRHVQPETDEAKELALQILALHNAGMVDEEMLSAAIAYSRPEARSA
ncbi:MAG: hypothetical protein DI629_00600 [Mesorhizobium amorphae]|nr:MAG: hypothetical protein DI629_00600 [Mesorhizobium amorphae]